MSGSSGPRRPTLEDVAAEAGVSRATVSRVVNGVRNVDPKLVETVRAAVAKTGYVPNLAARTLVTKRTGSIALVVSEAEHRTFDDPFLGRVFTDPFFGRIVTGIMGVLRPMGVNLVLMLTDSEESRLQLIGYLRQGHVDGVMLISGSVDDPLPGLIAGTALPAVMSRRPGPSMALSYVDAAQHAGGRLAAEHLVARGCRRIATISGPLDMPAARERLAGFLEATDAAGLDDVPTVEGNFTHESGESAMARLLDEHPDIDGVFAGNDLMAQGALLVLHDRGRVVPDDVALIGFDDSPSALAARPPLTTIRQPLEEMAGEMARLLLARVDEPGRAPASVIFEPTLVVRESA